MCWKLIRLASSPSGKWDPSWTLLLWPLVSGHCSPSCPLPPGRMGLEAYQHQKSCNLMHTGKWDSKWWQTMGERKWGQSGSNYCHAQPQQQGLVGETEYETIEELGNGFSFKTDPLALLCWNWNAIFYFLPWWQIWGKKDALLTSSVYHAKENGSLKDCSCGKTEVELMDFPEGGLSCHRAAAAKLSGTKRAGISNTSVHRVQTPSVVI